MNVHPFTILHIPHSSVEIPADLLADYLISDEEFALELLRMTDQYTDELFDLQTPQAAIVRFPVSRLVVDPERFPDDANEDMARFGMGAVYTHTSDGKTLRASDAGRRVRLLERFYYPHHGKLNTLAGKFLQDAGRCLIIDGHSFPSVPFPYELDQSSDRPDICIGTDPFHTPDWLTEDARDLFGKAGFSVSINRPFSGTLAPSAYHHQNKRVISLMVELKRSLYMDEQTGERLDSLALLRQTLHEVISQIIDRVGHG